MQIEEIKMNIFSIFLPEEPFFSEEVYAAFEGIEKKAVLFKIIRYLVKKEIIVDCGDGVFYIPVIPA